MKLKVCGMRDSQNIRELLLLNPDYMGFIFYEKSPRNVGEVLDDVLLKSFPESVQKVGVFVNASLDFVKEKVARYGLQLVQLHGDESPAYVADLFAVGIRVMKVFSVGDEFDFKQLGQYNPFVEYFLFDTKGKARGGNGEVFNWELLKGYDQKIPFFLSGGIDLENVDELEKLETMNIHAIDVNSKFELEPGLKSIEKVEKVENEIIKRHRECAKRSGKKFVIAIREIASFAHRLSSDERLAMSYHNKMSKEETYRISTDKSRLDLGVLHGFLTNSYWSPGIPRETVQKGY